MSRPVTDEELNQATGTIERWYRQWASSTAEDLVKDFIRGEIDDLDGFIERLDETTDSAMVYNVDQSRTLFASDSVDEAMQEVEGMGGGGENAQAALAVTTFRIDVRRAMPDFFGDIEDMDKDERLEWLIEEHSQVLHRGEDLDAFYCVVEDMDLGVLLRKGNEDDGFEYEFVSVRSVVQGEHGRELAVAWDVFSTRR